MNTALQQHIKSHLSVLSDPVLDSFVQALTKQYQSSLLAVFFYGSCMRNRQYHDALLDFYIVVDDYSKVYSKRWWALANALLPPNVFYLQVELDGEIYRCKYAVVSQKALEKEVSQSFHPYFWARFTQPVAVIYHADASLLDWAVNIQCQAATQFFKEVSASIVDAGQSESFWLCGFQLTYATELRAESGLRARVLYDNHKTFYDGIFACCQALAIKKTSYKSVRWSLLSWKLRNVWGKFLSVARLMKASGTFTNGIDYLAWKIERHSGEKIVVSNNVRKYPLLFCWPLLIKLLGKGKIR